MTDLPLLELPGLLKAVIESAKASASISAVWSHAGRVAVCPGEDAVQVACVTAWSAIRQDIAPLAAGRCRSAMGLRR